MIKKNNKGIALILAIVISFIVIAIGFSVANISLRQLQISIAAKEGMKAVYASDAGIECIRYWSTKSPSYFSSGGPTSGFDEVKCGNQNFNLSSAYDSSLDSYDFSFNIEGVVADVTVKREIINEDGVQKNVVNLVSNGYNNSSKGYESYRKYVAKSLVGSGSSGAKDIMIAIDASGTMGGDRSQRRLDECTSASFREIDCAIHAARSFIDSLLDTESDRIVGFASFAGTIRCPDGPDISDIDPTTGYYTDCYIKESNANNFRLDLEMVGSEDKGRYLDSNSGLLSFRSNFATNTYISDWSNYQSAAVYSLAELTGNEVRPRVRRCTPRRGRFGIHELFCTYNSFPSMTTLGSDNRDRPDDEYPDAFIMIGDFLVNTYTDNDWIIKTPDSDTPVDTRRARSEFASVLEDMQDEGIDMHFVVIGGSSDSNRIFNVLDTRGVEYTRYDGENYDELEEILNSKVLPNLETTQVYPVTEK